MNMNAFRNAGFGEQFGKRFVTGLAAGAATAVMRGGKVTVQQIATDAFGNALGYSVADAMTSPGQQPNANAQVNAFVDAVNGFSQTGGVQYPGVQMAGGTRDEHIARMLSLANGADPGSVESLRQADGTYRVEINGVSAGLPSGMNSGSSLPSLYPDSYVTGNGTTSNGLDYEDWSTGARAMEVRAREIVVTALGTVGVLSAAGSGSISAIESSPWDRLWGSPHVLQVMGNTIAGKVVGDGAYGGSRDSISGQRRW